MSAHSDRSDGTPKVTSERRPVEDMIFDDVLRRAGGESPPPSVRERDCEAWRQGRDAAVMFIEDEFRSWLDQWELVEKLTPPGETA